jgi:hypothetical protein
MALFPSKPPAHFIPIHPDNANKKDWIILLEAGTIVGTPRDKLRVAQTTLDRKIVKRFNFSFKPQQYLVLDGYDPRIHALYFCPQLYRYDNDKLVPLQGEEIGTLIARALERGVNDRRPWYEPSERTPDQPVIDGPMVQEFDSVVVEMPNTRIAPAGVVTEPPTKTRGPGR